MWTQDYVLLNAVNYNRTNNLNKTKQNQKN